MDAENVIKLLTFDAVEKNKAVGSELTHISARLSDLIKVFPSSSYEAWTCTDPVVVVAVCAFFVTCITMPATMAISTSLLTAMISLRRAAYQDYSGGEFSLFYANCAKLAGGVL